MVKYVVWWLEGLWSIFGVMWVVAGMVTAMVWSLLTCVAMMVFMVLLAAQTRVLYEGLVAVPWWQAVIFVVLTPLAAGMLRDLVGSVGYRILFRNASDV